MIVSKIWLLLNILKIYKSPGKSIGLKFIPSQLELFRFIPISVSEPMRIIPNQSEQLFVSRLMKNGQKSIRPNSTNSETFIRMNPKQSETKFSIQIYPNQSKLGLIQTEFSIGIISTLDSHGLILIKNSVWINPSSN